MTVAALYIDPRGPYPSIPDVECWDAERDATRYEGSWPVVSHPPCGPWGRFRWRCGQDGSTGPIAVEQVRRWGGILEHPVGSALWPFCRIPQPGWLPDPWGGFTIRVDQCRWGHPCAKATWLYMVGVDPVAIVLPPWREPTHSIGDTVGGLPEIPKSQRHITPPDFAEWLVELARTVK